MVLAKSLHTLSVSCQLSIVSEDPRSYHIMHSVYEVSPGLERLSSLLFRWKGRDKALHTLAGSKFALEDIMFTGCMLTIIKHSAL